jgi:hypothetical protein
VNIYKNHDNMCVQLKNRKSVRKKKLRYRYIMNDGMCEGVLSITVEDLYCCKRKSPA